MPALTSARKNGHTRVNDAMTPAVGKITHLTGRVLDRKRNPIKNARVEIWQVDNNGVYLHTESREREQRDQNFQGFGRFLTSSTGEYYFRTIRPVPYTSGIQRTPHIHFIVEKGGKRMLTTQMYVKGHPMNERNSILQNIPSGAARESVLVDFKPIQDSRIGELRAHFDIVIGETPEDGEDPQRYQDRGN